MVFRIKILAKNLQSLKKFLLFVKKMKIFNNLFLYLPKKNTKKFLTILKSPHVNKSAQEQFEYRIYGKTILVKSLKQYSNIHIMKKLQNLTFSGISLKIEAVIEKRKFQGQLLTRINPDKINVRFFDSDSQVIPKSNIKQYIQLFDAYGELVLQKSLEYSTTK